MEWTNGNYILTDDKNCLDVKAVCRLLSDTDWAANRPVKVIVRSLGNSLCFGLFHDAQQVGFARAVTDHATFTWICDVIIQTAHRGQGLGKWMVQCVVDHSELRHTTQVLRTKDAQNLYARYGFERVEYLRRAATPA